MTASLRAICSCNPSGVIGARPSWRLLEVKGLRRRFGGVTALDGADLTVEPGRITGLIGPNGAGKTTLFNAVTGALRPNGGAVDVRRHGCHRMAARQAGEHRPLAHVPDRARSRPAHRDREPDAVWQASAGRDVLRRRAAHRGVAHARRGIAGARHRGRTRAQPAAGRRQSRDRSFRRTEEAARTRPRADGRAEADHARRARRRHQSDAGEEARRAHSGAESAAASPS